MEDSLMKPFVVWIVLLGVPSLALFGLGMARLWWRPTPWLDRPISPKTLVRALAILSLAFGAPALLWSPTRIIGIPLTLFGLINLVTIGQVHNWAIPGVPPVTPRKLLGVLLLQFIVFSALSWWFCSSAFPVGR